MIVEFGWEKAGCRRDIGRKEVSEKGKRKRLQQNTSKGITSLVAEVVARA